MRHKGFGSQWRDRGLLDTKEVLDDPSEVATGQITSDFPAQITPEPLIYGRSDFAPQLSPRKNVIQVGETAILRLHQTGQPLSRACEPDSDDACMTKADVAGRIAPAETYSTFSLTQ